MAEKNPDIRAKLKILYLKDIFTKFYDEEHYITLLQMQQKLEEYGIRATRKTLYDDIEFLRIYIYWIEIKCISF